MKILILSAAAIFTLAANVPDLAPWGPHLLTVSNMLLWERVYRLDRRLASHIVASGNHAAKKGKK
jgi:hypothetical protein